MKALNYPRKRNGSGRDRGSLLLIGWQTEELFTATGWRVPPFYGRLWKGSRAPCIKTLCSSEDLGGTVNKQSDRRSPVGPLSLWFAAFFPHPRPKRTERLNILWMFSNVASCLHTLGPYRHLISFRGAEETGGHLIPESFISPV